MHAILHIVGVETSKDLFDELIGREADIHEDGLGTLIEPFDMLTQESNTAIMEAQALPDAIAQDEA